MNCFLKLEFSNKIDETFNEEKKKDSFKNKFNKKCLPNNLPNTLLTAIKVKTKKRRTNITWLAGRPANKITEHMQ